jgi:hypothetical protein
MKRTKKILFTGLLITAPVFSGFSQLYIGLGSGYGFGIANMDFYADESVITGTSVTYTSNKTSLGQGIPITLTAGLKLKDHIAAEIGFSYLLGSKDEFLLEDNFGNREKIELKARMLRIVPARTVFVW